MPYLEKVIAKSRAEAYLKAQQEAEVFFAPHLQRWLDLEVKKNNLSNHEAGQDFLVSEVNDEGVEFQSEMSEETWQYGGHELHYGNTITVPWNFFDDPESFFVEFERQKEQEKALRAKENQKDKERQVRVLEAQLAKARAELDSTEQKG